jgi:hypothetical protein
MAAQPPTTLVSLERVRLGFGAGTPVTTNLFTHPAFKGRRPDQQ